MNCACSDLCTGGGTEQSVFLLRVGADPKLSHFCCSCRFSFDPTLLHGTISIQRPIRLADGSLPESAPGSIADRRLHGRSAGWDESSITALVLTINAPFDMLDDVHGAKLADGGLTKPFTKASQIAALG